MTTDKNTKRNCCPDAAARREIKHLQKVFGSDLQNYSHTGYAEAQLSNATAATSKGNKKKRRKMN